LAFRAIERSRIIDDVVRSFNLSGIRPLGGHPPFYLALSCYGIDFQAGRQTLGPLFIATRNHDEPIESFICTRFKNQRGFNDGHGFRIVIPDFVHPLVLPLDNRRMHNPIQVRDARFNFTVRAECSFC
jgi:hypothetical protein